jgi:hypothetical protein
MPSTRSSASVTRSGKCHGSASSTAKPVSAARKRALSGVDEEAKSSRKKKNASQGVLQSQVGFN